MSRIFSLLAGLLLTSQALAAEPPQVLTSIKPLQLIAAEITAGVSTPEVLLPPGANPHSYQLRPSERRALAEADLVLWVGPALAPYLEKLLQEKPELITAMELPGVQVAEFGTDAELHTHHSDEAHTEHKDEHPHPDHDEHEPHQASAVEEHQHEDHHGHTAHEDKHDHDKHAVHEGDHDDKQDAHAGEHNHSGDDPHIWLYPENAQVIARTLSARLEALDPAHGDRYRSNLARFETELDQFLTAVPTRFPHLKQQGIYVFHDAWGYLGRAFDLDISNHITLSPEQQPGLRHLTELHEEFKQHAPFCLMLEPVYTPAYLERLIEDLPVTEIRVDPLGNTIDPAAGAYLEFLRTTLETIDRCQAASA